MTAKSCNFETLLHKIYLFCDYIIFLKCLYQKNKKDYRETYFSRVTLTKRLEVVRLNWFSLKKVSLFNLFVFKFTKVLHHKQQQKKIIFWLSFNGSAFVQCPLTTGPVKIWTRIQRQWPQNKSRIHHLNVELVIL